MEDLIGFINANKNRLKILEILESKGAADSKRVAKIARLIPSAVDNLLEGTQSDGLIQKGLVQKTADGKVELTAGGKSALDTIRVMSA
jgi:Mn-dependent DtxR family transcriptional regulator